MSVYDRTSRRLWPWGSKGQCETWTSRPRLLLIFHHWPDDEVPWDVAAYCDSSSMCLVSSGMRKCISPNEARNIL